MAPQSQETSRAGHEQGGGGSGGRANRLIHESSPYLLQHAHNPVDWWPWGAAAFDEARRRDVPILLSVGYSTCYWCHVMERECFESEAIAAQMNGRFVCIKLDREERPDVDDAYMNALLAMTGQGGWPMSCFLEPRSLKPFWCGTYFPPEPAMGRPSWPQVLDGIAAAWRDQRDEVMAQSEALAETVAARFGDPAVVPVGAAQVSDAVGILLRMFDATNGGFGHAPKFPQPVFLDLLLEARPVVDDATRAALDGAVRRTLDKMACGGLFDQAGGGFHRYSVDAFWLVPHFEKMLYDNAQLAMTYLRASEVYGDSWYAAIARRTLDYVLREMTGSAGGFFSAQDAEVDQREGLNYLWMPAEFDELLGEDAAFAKRVYGLDAGPNFRDPHHPGEPARNVLRLDDRPDRIAAVLGLGVEELAARLGRVNARLLAARSQRRGPHLDDKVIAAWNGLMIAAMARGYRVLADRRYLDAAVSAAGVVLNTMRNGAGELLRVSRAGRAATPGVLEDYTFLAAGLIELHRAAVGEPVAIAGRPPAEWADELFRTARRLFKDSTAGAYMDAEPGRADLFVQIRSTHDGALPSANSVLLNVLIDLAEIDSRGGHRDEAIGVLASLSGAIQESPVGAANAVRGLLRLLLTAPDQVRAAVGEPAAAAEPAPEQPTFTPVEVYADRERLTVGKDRPGELRLVIRIAPGHHILAAEAGPGGKGLTPLRVGVTGGEGLVVYADYPPGSAYGDHAELLVHEDQIEFSVAVEQQGEWRGRPVLTVTYQACTDAHCLAPTTVELDVAIERA